MHEGYNSGDEFVDDGEFDHVMEHTVPSSRVPFKLGGISGALSPENTKIRLFGEGLEWYSRAIVKLDDGTSVSLKLDDDLLRFLSKSGCETRYPKQPDETDAEFVEEYIDVSAENLDTDLTNLL